MKFLKFIAFTAAFVAAVHFGIVEPYQRASKKRVNGAAKATATPKPLSAPLPPMVLEKHFIQPERKKFEPVIYIPTSPEPKVITEDLREMRGEEVKPCCKGKKPRFILPDQSPYAITPGDNTLIF